jgi:hypothetical protein
VGGPGGYRLEVARCPISAWPDRSGQAKIAAGITLINGISRSRVRSTGSLPAGSEND